MKQFLTIVFCLFFTITGYAENKIKMVTYFPVPYVAYSQVNVTNQMDIGLTSACTMKLGCTESGNAGLRPLNVTNTFLKKGKLELNTGAAVTGSTVSIGSGSGSVSMDFGSNLRVGTLNDGYSVEVENKITVDTLKLFPNRIKTNFPSCSSTGAPGAPTIAWKKLKLKKQEDTFLVCGTPKEICQPPRGKSYYDYSCPSGYEGYLWYGWDYDSCKYQMIDECRPIEYKWIRDKTYDYAPGLEEIASDLAANIINHSSCRYLSSSGLVPSYAANLSGCSSTECGSCSASQSGKYGFMFSYPSRVLCYSYRCQ